MDRISHGLWNGFLSVVGVAAGLASPGIALGMSGGGGLEAEVATASALHVDRDRALSVVDFALERPSITYLFEEGTFYPVVDGHGRDVGAVFLGDGQLTYAPDDPLQKTQLYQWTWFNTQLAEPFSEGLILFTGDSPLPAVGWGQGGRQAREAERVLRKRWRRQEKWASLPDRGLIWEHSRAPNLALDLAEDALDPVAGPGMRFVEVNAQPRKRSLYRRTTPERWWMALYESPRGVQPVFRTDERGVLFTHGDQQGRWLSHVFYAYEPAAYGPRLSADVRTSDQEVTLRWDGQMERLHLFQQVRLDVDAGGQVARLLLVPREPKTTSTIARNETPTLRVEAVKVGGAAVDFLQRDGEVLFALPGGRAGAVELTLRSDMPLGGGAQAGSGPFALYDPVGAYFDAVQHRLTVHGPEGFTVVASRDPLRSAGAPAGGMEPPSLALGRFVEATLGSDGDLRAYAWRNQLQTPYEPEAVAAMMLREGARIASFYEQVMGGAPFESLSFVESAQGYDPSGVVPMSAWALRAQTQEARLDAFRNRAYKMAAQWWGNGVSLADPLEDYWLFAGLQSFMANWAMESLLDDDNWLDQHLDEWRRKALDAERPSYRVYVASGGGLEAQALAVSARGYLLFNNLRLAVGDQRMALALQGVYRAMEGQAVTSDTFIAALSEALSLDLSPLLDEGLPGGPYEGRLEVVYNVTSGPEGSVLQAVTDGHDPGPTLGAAIRIDLKDGRQLKAFVPLGGGLELVLPAGVKRVVPVERGSGLVAGVDVSTHPGPLWTDGVSDAGELMAP